MICLATFDNQNKPNENFRASAWAALRHRNYRIFWSGQMVSLAGTWMQNMAQAWLVLELTGSPFLLGLLGASQFGPFLLFSLLAGVAADRFSKHRLLILIQLILLVLALLLGTLTWLNLIQYWHVLIIAFLVGTANAFDLPVRQSFYVELVGRDDLMNAIALNSSIFNGARVVGPAAAGLVIVYYGIEACFFLNAASFLAVLAGLLLMRVDGAVMEGKGSVFFNIREGLDFIKVTPAVYYPMALMAVMSIFAMNFQVLIPAFARIVLEQDASGFGFLMSAHGLGALLGSVGLAFVSHGGPRRFLLISGALGLCLFQLLLAPVRLYYPAIFLMALIGWSMVTFTATVNATIQMAAPDAIRGRIVSIYSLVFVGFIPIGNLISGFLARQWGAPAAMALGAVVGLFSVALLSSRFVRALKRADPN